MYSVHSKKITVPAKGSEGPCRRGPSLGESGHGLIGYIGHVGKRKPIYASYGGLLLAMDGGLPLSDKTAISVADVLFSNIVCRFGMPSVIHSDQGREFEDKVMHELCILGGAHKTKTTPYHPESDGLVERLTEHY